MTGMKLQEVVLLAQALVPYADTTLDGEGALFSIARAALLEHNDKYAPLAEVQVTPTCVYNSDTKTYTCTANVQDAHDISAVSVVYNNMPQDCYVTANGTGIGLSFTTDRLASPSLATVVYRQGYTEDDIDTRGGHALAYLVAAHWLTAIAAVYAGKENAVVGAETVNYLTRSQQARKSADAMMAVYRSQMASPVVSLRRNYKQSADAQSQIVWEW